MGNFIKWMAVVVVQGRRRVSRGRIPSGVTPLIAIRLRYPADALWSVDSLHFFFYYVLENVWKEVLLR